MEAVIYFKLHSSLEIVAQVIIVLLSTVVLINTRFNDKRAEFDLQFS